VTIEDLENHHYHDDEEDCKVEEKEEDLQSPPDIEEPILAKRKI
jgi:hypothetical protein